MQSAYSVTWPTLALLLCSSSTVYASTSCTTMNFGPNLTYTPEDTPNHNSNGHAAIILDDFGNTRCCGVVKAWQISVQGTTGTDPTCQASIGGCDIDFIVWTDLQDTPAPYFTATVHGINRANVNTDPGWNTDSSIVTTISIPPSEQIPIYDTERYYMGWNCDAFQAVDYVEDSFTWDGNAGFCTNTSGVVCLPYSQVYTTEYANYNRGYPVNSLSVGSPVDTLYYPMGNDGIPFDRFYAINAIIDAGNPPYFVDPMFTTTYVLATTSTGSTVYRATALNDETLQILTYSIQLETPSDGSKYFTIDNTTGDIITTQSLSPFIGTRNLALEVSDGCLSNQTVIRIVIYNPTTTVQTTTSAATTTSSPTTTIADTTTSLELTTTSIPTTIADTTTSLELTTTSIPTTTADTTTSLELTTTSIPTTTADTTTSLELTTTSIPTTIADTTTSLELTTTSIPTTTADTTTSLELTTTSIPTTTADTTTSLELTTTSIPTTTADTTTSLGVTTASATTITYTTGTTQTQTVNVQTTSAAKTTAPVTTGLITTPAVTTSTTLTTGSTTVTTATGPTTTPGLLDTASGKAIVSVAAILGAAALATLVGLCLVLNKNPSAGAVHGMSAMTQQQFKGHHGQAIKMNVKPRYLDSERKLWEWS